LSFRHNKHHSYLLRCLLKCGLCGFNMFGRTYAATATLPAHRYYNCKGKDLIGSGRAERCPQRTIKADEVEPSSGITSLRYYVIPSNSSHSLRHGGPNPTRKHKQSYTASKPRNNG